MRKDFLDHDQQTPFPASGRFLVESQPPWPYLLCICIVKEGVLRSLMYSPKKAWLIGTRLLTLASFLPVFAKLFCRLLPSCFVLSWLRIMGPPRQPGISYQGARMAPRAFHSFAVIWGAAATRRATSLLCLWLPYLGFSCFQKQMPRYFSG